MYQQYLLTYGYIDYYISNSDNLQNIPPKKRKAPSENLRLNSHELQVYICTSKNVGDKWSVLKTHENTHTDHKLKSVAIAVSSRRSSSVNYNGVVSL